MVVSVDQQKEAGQSTNCQPQYLVSREVTSRSEPYSTANADKSILPLVDEITAKALMLRVGLSLDNFVNVSHRINHSPLALFGWRAGVGYCEKTDRIAWPMLDSTGSRIIGIDYRQPDDFANRSIEGSRGLIYSSRLHGHDRAYLLGAGKWMLQFAEVDRLAAKVFIVDDILEALRLENQFGPRFLSIVTNGCDEATVQAFTKRLVGVRLNDLRRPSDVMANALASVTSADESPSAAPMSNLARRA